jgi:hypothetical protein
VVPPDPKQFSAPCHKTRKRNRLVWLGLSLVLLCLSGATAWYGIGELKAKRRGEANNLWLCAQSCFAEEKWQEGITLLRSALPIYAKTNLFPSGLMCQEAQQSIRVLELLESTDPVSSIADNLTGASASEWKKAGALPAVLRTISLPITKRTMSFMKNNGDAILSRIQQRELAARQEIDRKEREVLAEEERAENQKRRAQLAEELRLQVEADNLKRIEEWNGVPLRAEVIKKSENLTVTNKNPFAWNVAVIGVNPEEYSAYTLTISGLAPGASTSLKLRDFMTESGNRFNPEYTGIQDVGIVARTDYGQKIYLAHLVQGTSPGAGAHFVQVNDTP